MNAIGDLRCSDVPTPSREETDAFQTDALNQVTGFGAKQVFLIAFVTLTSIALLHVFRFCKNIFNALRDYHKNLTAVFTTTNQTCHTAESTKQVPLLSPFLCLIEIYIKTIATLITGIAIASILGVAVLALFVLAVSFLMVISLVSTSNTHINPVWNII